MCSIARMRGKIGVPGFLERVFVEEELEYAMGRHDPAQSLAASFAAREAVAKAFGIAANIDFPLPASFIWEMFTQVLADVDLVLFVIESGRFGPADEQVVKLLPEGAKVILVVNKVDLLEDKARMLPFLQKMSAVYPFAEIVPVSAEKGRNTAELLKAAEPYLPEGDPIFDADDITDRSERFLAAEFLREKLFRQLGEELPYGMTVEIEKFEAEPGLRRIHAAIIVDRDAHKAMVIGKGGERLKRIATEARLEMEKLFESKVFLETWVKVKSGWADDERALKSLGYE